MTHVTEAAAKTANFIRESALNNGEFIALSGETKSGYGEIIYHQNVMWLIRGLVLQQLFQKLKEVKLFVQNKKKRTGRFLRP
jgi:hypothetical protein